ncbi:hypothetical protein LC76P1_00196 [Lysinibacillus phage LC76P1]|nr:hypothetical protein LC76P1_00196 [Lysinibacillus phage LC76P1]
MTVINLRERKAVLENLINNLQVELNHINSELEVQEAETIQEVIAVAVDKTEEELLRECDTFSVEKTDIMAITPKVAKSPKKEKLTKAQQEVMDAVYKAIPYYGYEYNEGARILKGCANRDLYINGKSASHERDENGVMLVRQHAYYLGNGEYGYEMSSNTLKALERKGYIKIVRDRGVGLDIFTLVDAIEPPTVYTELSELVYDLGCKYNSTRSFFCPVGQEEETKAEIAKWYSDYKFLEVDKREVYAWNGRAE